jgi:hypothetical protein
LRATVYGKERQIEVAAVAKGLRSLGAAVTWSNHGYFEPTDAVDCDVVVTFGQRLHSGLIAETYRKMGTPVLTVDLPPIRTEDDAFRALWVDRVNWVPPGPLPGDRLIKMQDKHGLAMCAKREGGKDILICGQAQGDAAHNMNMEAIQAWAASVVRSAGHERCVWRPHPQTPFVVKGVRLSCPMEDTLEEALASAWHCLVTFNSTCGLKAILAGIPVVCSPSSFYAEVAEISLSRIDDPRWPTLEERVSFFSRLAYAQWTLDELESGEALDFALAHAGVREPEEVASG